MPLYYKRSVSVFPKSDEIKRTLDQLLKHEIVPVSREVAYALARYKCFRNLRASRRFFIVYDHVSRQKFAYLPRPARLIKEGRHYFVKLARKP